MTEPRASARKGLRSKTAWWVEGEVDWGVWEPVAQGVNDLLSAVEWAVHEGTKDRLPVRAGAQVDVSPHRPMRVVVRRYGAAYLEVWQARHVIGLVVDPVADALEAGIGWPDTEGARR